MEPRLPAPGPGPRPPPPSAPRAPGEPLQGRDRGLLRELFTPAHGFPAAPAPSREIPAGSPPLPRPGRGNRAREGARRVPAGGALPPLLPPEEGSPGRPSGAPGRTAHAPDAAASAASQTLVPAGPSAARCPPPPAGAERESPPESRARRAAPSPSPAGLCGRSAASVPCKLRLPPRPAPAGARRTQRAWPDRPASRRRSRCPWRARDGRAEGRNAGRAEGRNAGLMDGWTGGQRRAVRAPAARSPGTPAGRVRRQGRRMRPAPR